MRLFKAGLVGLLMAGAVASGVLADGIKGAPPPFDKGGVKIALVSYLSQGDYFEAYEAGGARQAKALGVDLHIFQASRTPPCSASRSSRRSRLAFKASS